MAEAPNRPGATGVHGPDSPARRPQTPTPRSPRPTPRRRHGRSAPYEFNGFGISSPGKWEQQDMTWVMAASSYSSPAR
jgi:hypothetical protein